MVLKVFFDKKKFNFDKMNLFVVIKRWY